MPVKDVDCDHLHMLKKIAARAAFIVELDNRNEFFDEHANDGDGYCDSWKSATLVETLQSLKDDLAQLRMTKDMK